MILRSFIVCFLFFLRALHSWSPEMKFKFEHISCLLNLWITLYLIAKGATLYGAANKSECIERYLLLSNNKSGKKFHGVNWS